MPIFEKHKLLFVHVPKTAGRSVTELLGEHEVLPGGIHQSFESYAGCRDLESYNSFTIARDPADRIRSGFRQIKQSDERNEMMLKAEFPGLFDGDFNDFILHSNFIDFLMRGTSANLALVFYPSSYQFMAWSLYQQQGFEPGEVFYDSIINPKNPGNPDLLCLLPHFALRYNNLQQDLMTMARLLEIDITITSLPHIGKTVRQDNFVLDPKAERLLKHLYDLEYRINNEMNFIYTLEETPCQ